MMKAHRLIYICAAVAVASLVSFQSAQAGTILKLSLGNDVQPDLQYVGGVLSTVDDLGPTIGDQETAIEFLDFLSSFTNIPSGASYSLGGATANGAPTIVFGTVVLQPLTGGNFQLYDDNDNLLLDAVLGDSVLQGTTGLAGPAATGAVFSTTFGNDLSGPLAAYIAPNTITVSIAMTGVNTGGTPGMIVSPQNILENFVADATETIAAEPVPEPTAAVMILIGLLAAPLAAARRR